MEIVGSNDAVGNVLDIGRVAGIVDVDRELVLDTIRRMPSPSSSNL